MQFVVLWLCFASTLILMLANECFGLEEDEDLRMAKFDQSSSAAFPTWSLDNRVPMTSMLEEKRDEKGPFGSKYKRKYKKYMLPLLLAYKLKFFTLIPVFIGGLLLLTGATGLAGFFFALFAAAMGLKKTEQGHFS